MNENENDIFIEGDIEGDISSKNEGDGCILVARKHRVLVRYTYFDAEKRQRGSGSNWFELSSLKLGMVQYEQIVEATRNHLIDQGVEFPVLGRVEVGESV